MDFALGQSCSAGPGRELCRAKVLEDTLDRTNGQGSGHIRSKKSDIVIGRDPMPRMCAPRERYIRKHGTKNKDRDREMEKSLLPVLGAIPPCKKSLNAAAEKRCSAKLIARQVGDWLAGSKVHFDKGSRADGAESPANIRPLEYNFSAR